MWRERYTSGRKRCWHDLIMHIYIRQYFGTTDTAPAIPVCSSNPCVLQQPLCAPATTVCSSNPCVLQQPLCAPATTVCSSNPCVLQQPLCAPATTVCSSNPCVLQQPLCVPATPVFLFIHIFSELKVTFHLFLQILCVFCQSTRKAIYSTGQAIYSTGQPI